MAHSYDRGGNLRRTNRFAIQSELWSRWHSRAAEIILRLLSKIDNATSTLRLITVVTAQGGTHCLQRVGQYTQLCCLDSLYAVLDESLACAFGD